MKIVHISTTDWSGGAAIAANRIVNAQQNFTELKSVLFVQYQRQKIKYVHSYSGSKFKNIVRTFNKFTDEFAIRLLSVQSRGRFTFPYFGEDISQIDLIKDADILNLHWINGGFLSLKSLEKIAKMNKPILWTLHDMWAFTGGCHYTSGCIKFQDHCSNCPSLFFKSDKDASYRIFDQKLELFDQLNLTVVTCSNWLAQEALKSRLFRLKNIFCIPNPIQIEQFKPLDKIKARESLKLPIGKKLILIGAMNLKDERKGFRFLIEALDTLKNIDFELIVFGKLDKNIIQKIPVKIHQLGKLKNEAEIVMAYNAADVYAAPSLQDNLPNTVMESMACGVPVVAFNVGGIPDMVDQNVNGILVMPRSSEELSDGIKLLLSNDNLRQSFSNNARDKVAKNFDEKIVAEKYIEVYKSML